MEDADAKNSVSAKEQPGRLRVTFIVGALNKGGAEKQFIYMLRVLTRQNAEIQVLTLTKGEYHEQSLANLGIVVEHMGSGSPLTRLARILGRVRAFRPHFIQATHFFTTLYAGLVGRLLGIPSIGAIRGDLHHDLKGVGRSGPWLLKLPSVLLANSQNAYENALTMGIAKNRLLVLQNVIDLDDFDRQSAASAEITLSPDRVRAITVARLMPVKRLERFIQSIAMARKQAPELEGVIVGSGPEEDRLHHMADDMGLLPNHIRFLGERADIPQLLNQSHIAMLTSDREGFPNVLLEAMAAGIPILSTPAGEARTLVEENGNGFLVPFEDTDAMASRLIRLAQSPALRRTMGNHGRRTVEQKYSFPRLEQDLFEVYRIIARMQQRSETLALLQNNLLPGRHPFTPLHDEYKRAKLRES